MNTLQKSRISWIDMAKGYGIIFIILSHLDTGIVSELMNSFHVPLFFFLSGFVFSARKDFKDFFIGKCKSLLLPYVYLGIPLMLFYVAISTLQNRTYLNAQNILKLVSHFILQQRMWTIWFLTALFVLEMIFYFLVKKVKNNKIIGIVCVIMPAAALIYYHIGGKALIWNADICFTAIPFFYAGYICKCNKDRFEKLFFKKNQSIPWFVLFTAINLAAFIINGKLTDEHFNMFQTTYGNPIITYIGAFSGVLAMVIFSNFFTLKSIRFIGINSIIYFGLHQTIFLYITKKILSALSVDTLLDEMPEKIIYIVIELIIIILSITVLQLIINKIKDIKERIPA